MSLQDHFTAGRIEDLMFWHQKRLELWAKVNALGGEPTTDFDRGFAEAIGKVLNLLEDAGITEGHVE